MAKSGGMKGTAPQPRGPQMGQLGYKATKVPMMKSPNSPMTMTPHPGYMGSGQSPSMTGNKPK